MSSSEGEEVKASSFFATKLQSLVAAEEPVLGRRKTKRMRDRDDEKAVQKKSKIKAEEKKALNRVNLEQPQQFDVVYEKQMRKVATRGGKSSLTYTRLLPLLKHNPMQYSITNTTHHNRRSNLS